MGFWLLLSAVIIGLAIGLIGMALLHLPRTRIAGLVWAFIAFGVLWAIGDLIAETAADMAWKQAGLAVLYTGSIAAPACWWAIALRWADASGADLPLRGVVWERAPFAFAGAMWLVMLSNPWHGAFIEPVVGGRNVYQPLWYAMAVPNYALIAAALAVELVVVARVPRGEVRRQGAFLIAASLVTLIGNWLYVGDLLRVNPTTVVLAVSGTLLAVGMAREGLFGVLPAALRDIAADHPDGLVVVDPHGQVRFANARAHELLAPIEIGGSFDRTLRDARLVPDTPDLFGADDESPWDRLARPGGVLFRLDARRTRWLHVRATDVLGPFGRTKGHGVRIVDLTAHREAEIAARQARRLESTADLARAVSREFQGTFALVHSNAELLLSDVVDAEPAIERKLARILDAARHGGDLALQLQSYTGSVSTSRVVLELSDVVLESCELVEADLPPGLRVRFERRCELLPVCVDAIQLRHCLFAALVNAIEAMGDAGGEIHVSTGACHLDPPQLAWVWGESQPAGDYAFVHIRDAGGGMDPETLERAFEPFYSTRGKDRGAGLPMVLGIARAHGAPIALDNEPGRGCTFRLYFPIDRDDARPSDSER